MAETLDKSVQMTYNIGEQKIISVISQKPIDICEKKV